GEAEGLAIATSSHRAAPVTLTGADASVLRDVLADWTVDSVSALVGDRAVRALDREQVVPARRAAERAGSDRVALLTRLLTFGDSLPRAQAELALGEFGVDRAARAGLVVAAGAADDDSVQALVDVRPYSAVDAHGEVGWWIASD